MNPIRFPWWWSEKVREISKWLCQREKKSNHHEIHPELFQNKDLLSSRKNFARPYLSWRKVIPLTPVNSRLPISSERGKNTFSTRVRLHRNRLAILQPGKGVRSRGKKSCIAEETSVKVTVPKYRPAERLRLNCKIVESSFYNAKKSPVK